MGLMMKCCGAGQVKGAYVSIYVKMDWYDGLDLRWVILMHNVHVHVCLEIKE